MSERGLLATILLMVAGGVGFAAEQAKLAEESRVTVVEVPVYAVDRNGKPVGDLKPEEFLLFDDGKPQEVLFAHRVIAGRVVDQNGSAAAAPADEMVMQRHFVLVFDLTFNTLGGLKSARESAWRFVSEKLAPEEKAAVFSISQSAGLRMCANFTSDRERLKQAIGDLRGSDAGGLLAESAGLFEKQVDPKQQPVVAGPGLGAVPALEDGLEDMLAALGPELRDQISHIQRFDRFTLRKSVWNYLDMLRSLAQSLNVLPGRKIVVLFSTGFNSNQVFFNDEGPPGTSGVMNIHESVDTTAGQTDTTSLEMAKKAMGYFSTSDCRLYTADTAGMGAYEQQDTTRSNQDTLAMLAEEAGGRFFKSSTASAKILDLIEDETREYYLLAYSPPPGSGKGDYHEITVKVSRPGLDITHRKGYYDRKPFKKYSPLEKDLHVAEILLNDRSHAEIEFSAAALGFPARAAAWEGFTEVVLHVFLPGEENREVLGDNLEVFAFALTDEGRIADFFRSRQRVSEEEQKELVRAGGMSYTDRLMLRPGEYELKFIVRNAQTGATGTQDARIAVPDYNRDTFFMATPCFISLRTNTLDVSALGAKGFVERYKDLSATYPLAFGEANYLPSAMPDVAAEPAPLLFLRFYNVQTDPQTGKPRLRVVGTIQNGDGSKSRAAECALKRFAMEADGSAVMTLQFTPPRLDPGGYVLGILAEDQTNGATATGVVAFSVGEPPSS